MVMRRLQAREYTTPTVLAARTSLIEQLKEQLDEPDMNYELEMKNTEAIATKLADWLMELGFIGAAFILPYSVNPITEYSDGAPE